MLPDQHLQRQVNFRNLCGLHLQCSRQTIALIKLMERLAGLSRRVR
jgi:hypothetical protein